ncbi:hypothetical protein PTKIN_Ptkin10aG0052100 [Pterospermum kingtungense]
MIQGSNFTGVPAVVDLFCMRDAMSNLGGDSNKINLLPHYEEVDRLFNGPDVVHPGIILMTRLDCALKFLCDYHFTFCDVIPPSCIQMRNIILSAFPRNMRLPDQYTPNLKVSVDHAMGIFVSN